MIQVYSACNSLCYRVSVEKLEQIPYMLKLNHAAVFPHLLQILRHLKVFVLFDLILYAPSTIFQLCRNGSSWVEPVLI